jgi:hypothetical protein
MVIQQERGAHPFQTTLLKDAGLHGVTPAKICQMTDYIVNCKFGV